MFSRYIHVVTYISTLFLYMVEQSSIICAYYSSYICWSTFIDRYCFDVLIALIAWLLWLLLIDKQYRLLDLLAIVNSAIVNIYAQVSVWVPVINCIQLHLFSFFLGVELLGTWNYPNCKVKRPHTQDYTRFWHKLQVRGIPKTTLRFINLLTVFKQLTETPGLSSDKPHKPK